VIDPDDSPREPLPELPASLGASARLALDRVLQDGSEMATGWVDSAVVSPSDVGIWFPAR
jgi:hypothetical protein